MSVRFLQMASYTAPEIKEVQGNDYVNYGEDNEYFRYLIDRYQGSPTNNAILNGVIELMYGRGLDATDSNRKPDQYAQMKALFGKETLRRVISDYAIMGQCAFQVIYNEDRSAIVQVDHMPVESLRAEKCNDDGDITHYYYAKDWQAVAAKKETPVPYEAFGFGDSALQILYIKPYRAGYYYYSPVDYQGGLQYAMLEEEIANYHINNIQNGLAPSMVINFNNGQADEEAKDEMETRIRDKFSGSSNAGRFILAFNDNKDQAATIEPVQLSDASEQYKFLSEECRSKLMISHRITSPMLLGIKDNSGLGNNAQELESASILFENTVIEPKQEIILDGISQILAYNDISLNIYFKTLRPLEFSEMKVGDAEVVEEETGVKVNDQKLSAEEDALRLKIAEALIPQGEEVDLNEWELVDERPVDYDKEELRNAMFAFASVIPSDPNAKSEQDTSIIKVRYKYSSTRQAKGESREFCSMMEGANRVYRKEDIEAAGAANPGFGEGGANTYDIFLYKGGPWCQHYWMRQTYLRKSNKKITVNEARELINRLDPEFRNEARLPQNPKEVAKAPRDMPNNGYVNPRKK